MGAPHPLCSAALARASRLRTQSSAPTREREAESVRSRARAHARRRRAATWPSLPSVAQRLSCPQVTPDAQRRAYFSHYDAALGARFWREFGTSAHGGPHVRTLAFDAAPPAGFFMDHLRSDDRRAHRRARRARSARSGPAARRALSPRCRRAVTPCPRHTSPAPTWVFVRLPLQPALRAWPRALRWRGAHRGQCVARGTVWDGAVPGGPHPTGRRPAAVARTQSVLARHWAARSGGTGRDHV
jgi:hypothetical protein